MSRTKASFHIFHLHFLRKSCTKASFSHLPLSDLEGSLARKLRFHIFYFHFLREVSHESFVSHLPLSPEDGWGSLSGGRLRNMFVCTGIILGSAKKWKELPVQASFSQLELSKFEGSLARKLPFHICHFHFLREVSHESFASESSSFRFLREVSHESFDFTSFTFRS